MANRMKGEASFAHAGETRTLRITMDVLLQAEDETGAGLLELVNSQRVGWLASLLRHALAAAGEPLPSRADAAELLVRAEGAREAVMAAMMAALPEPDADVGNAPKT